MTNLNITERRIENVIILDLEGTIKLGEDCSNLRKTLRFLVQNGEQKILLNLANVSYIDSSGLGELVAGFASSQKNGGALKLLNVTERISELMMITKLLTVFDVYENEAVAVKSFSNISTKAASGSLL